MTMHYHGTPITPRLVMETLAGKCFCVSFADPRDIALAHQIGQSVMLDNGAFTAWTRGKPVDWASYYAWCEPWLRYATTWAIIPDVINGTEADNDDLLAAWPHGKRQGVPVWHLHESLDRLSHLVDEWPRICMGSSGDYSVVGSQAWLRRMDDAWDRIHARRPWVHMLRGFCVLDKGYPFASADSADIARNHSQRTGTAREMADRWDAKQCGHEFVRLDAGQVELFDGLSR